MADGGHGVFELVLLAIAAEPVDFGAPDAQDACDRLVDLVPVNLLARFDLIHDAFD